MKKIVNIVSIVAIGSIVLFAGYTYYRVSHAKNVISNKTEVNTNDLISKISKLYLIPNGEVPTVATVSDPEKLKVQSLFINAEIGDKVFFFTNAGRAILYRPSIDKIIDIVSVKSN